MVVCCLANKPHMRDLRIFKDVTGEPLSPKRVLSLQEPVFENILAPRKTTAVKVMIVSRRCWRVSPSSKESTCSATGTRSKYHPLKHKSGRYRSESKVPFLTVPFLLNSMWSLWLLEKSLTLRKIAKLL